MLKILISENNYKEKEYIIDTIFNFFLKIQYKIVLNPDVKDYVIKYNNRSLIIKDDFFAIHKGDYLNIKNIPEKISYYSSKVFSVSNLPVIYGLPSINEENDNITCDIDIFASCFFMLTRWEEIFSKDLDEHERYKAKDSLAYRFKFLNRPIVNEYSLLLKHLLEKIGSSPVIYSKYELILTHDVDHFFYKKNTLNNLFDQLNSKNRVYNIIHNLLYFLKNPYNTFDWLMKISEKYNLTSHFYFMGKKTHPLDGVEYYEKIRPAIDKITKRNHVVGFHPNYMSFDDLESWTSDKEFFDRIYKTDVKECRQHFLRFKLPKTWEIMEENNIKMDSTLGYSEIVGFRCGTGNVYPVFNVLTRQTYRLLERPLIVMDGTLKNICKRSLSKRYKIVKKIYRTCKENHTPLTILFHNSSFDNTTWRNNKRFYKRIVADFHN